jgi:hypothetical protein
LVPTLEFLVNLIPDITAATDDQIQDLITLLLDRAVAVSHALTKLHALAEVCPEGDPTAHAEVTEAIAEMTGIRSTLIANADHLTRLLQSPPPGT